MICCLSKIPRMKKLPPENEFARTNWSNLLTRNIDHN